MSKFLRKVAGAFVVLEDRQPGAAPGAPGMDEMTQETSTLLAQLEGSPAPTEPAAGKAAGAGSILDLTAEDVFREQGIVDSPNSALRLLKLVTGIAMFSRDQQLAMVRAMDIADDTWSEAAVVEDARRRQEVLRGHLQGLARERATRLDGLQQDVAQAKQSGEAIFAELDQRIALLHQRREQEAQATANAIAQLEQQKRELEQRELLARQGIAQVIQALAGLLAFLGAAPSSESK